MSCCGQNKNQRSVRNDEIAVRPAPRRTLEFEYVGRTGLNVTGPTSQIGYRFDRPGARATVDARDGASLARVPVLRQVGR
jgi:hypothetical protein